MSDEATADMIDEVRINIDIMLEGEVHRCLQGQIGFSHNT